MNTINKTDFDFRTPKTIIPTQASSNHSFKHEPNSTISCDTESHKNYNLKKFK